MEYEWVDCFQRRLQTHHGCPPIWTHAVGPTDISEDPNTHYVDDVQVPIGWLHQFCHLRLLP